MMENPPVKQNPSVCRFKGVAAGESRKGKRWVRGWSFNGRERARGWREVADLRAGWGGETGQTEGERSVVRSYAPPPVGFCSPQAVREEHGLGRAVE